MDCIPGIARYEPVDRRVGPQRVHVLRFPREKANDFASLKDAAGLTLANELRQIGGEQDVEDRVWLCVVDRLRNRARIDLPGWHSLFSDELNVGLPPFHYPLQRFTHPLPP